MMAAVAIAIWAIAVAWVAWWLREREAARAREHIRSIRFSRLDRGGPSRPNFAFPEGKMRASWGRVLAQAHRN